MTNHMDRHIQQTNDRLVCIKQHLSNPNGFQTAARELLEWCSDIRAFQGTFEQSLLSCLTVVSQVAAQPGYDLDLGYRLLAVCAAHREKFTPKASGLLSMWCEELGRLLLLRHQKNRNPDNKNPDMHPQLQKPMQHGPMGHGDPNVGWQGNQGGPQQSLSVVTTVWGVTPTTQTVPYNHTTPGGYNTNTTMSSTNYTQPPQGFPGNQMQKPGYENPGMYQRSNSYPCPSNYPPTPNTPGSTTPISAAPQKNDYHAPPAALSAAALVAAAATATATATATASMVALQEQQNQQQQLDMQMGMGNQYGPQMQMPPGQQQAPQYGNQYGGMPQRHPNPMGMGRGPGPGPGPMKNSMVAMYQRRSNSAPYLNPQQMMQAKRSQYPNGTQYGPGPQGPYQQYPNKPQYPAQQPLPSPTYGPQPGMRPNGPYPNGQNLYMNQGQFPPTRPNPNGQGYNFSSSPNQQTFQPNPNMNYPHSPLPGNPTPPITPNNVPPYPGDVKPPPNMCGPIKKDIDELRLTFPVRDGVVLPPFRLEHNLAVSNHVFHLRESVYQTLMWRSDLELQLKCFHHEDRQMNTNWPASVTVSVNATPLQIERGENKTSHRPLYLKEVCRPGRNTIQITVTACCCSHLFVLQLVHRPSVRSVLQGLLRKRLLPAEHCITKIKRNFTSAATSNSALNEDGVEQTAIKVSLKCPITFRRITLPARGHDCKHIQCFDLESYLQLNCERGQWRCPVCNKPALLEGLEIDQYIWGVLTNLANTEFEEVTIDPTASWKPVPIKTSVKEEDSGTEPCARWMKAMSPHSMQLPTMNSWDMGPNSPYSMPPSSQGPPFSGSYGPAGSGGGNFPPNGPQGDFPGNMLPMSPGQSLNNITNMNNMNSDIMNKPLTHSGQYPLSPPESTSHLRHPPDQSMNNHLPISSQSQIMNNQSQVMNNQSQVMNNHSTNGTHLQQQQPSNNNTSGQQQNQVGDDLNFDPTAIIDGDASTAGLELDNLGNLGDPIELLSYLGPSEPGDNNSTNNNTSGNQSNNNSSTNNNEDILSFFES